MANLWFKLYGGEYLSDPKIERLSPIERSCWITILCMASMGEGGVVEFLTVESLLNRSGVHYDPYFPEEWEKALGVLSKFEKLKMIELNDDGIIIVKNWNKRQEHNLTVAERVAKCRANKANVTNDVTNVTTEKNRIEKNRIEKNIKEEYKEESTKTNSFGIKDKELTELLYLKVKENYSFIKDKTEKQKIKDYEEMNRLHRIDERTYEQIEFIINFSQDDSFWKQNIRSVSKLRKQFDNLAVKAKSKYQANIVVEV